jgi:uridine kinase
MELRMPASDALDLYDLLGSSGIGVWVDGGWCVDALLGAQTRPHADLDIFIDAPDVPRFRSLLESRGYTDVPRDDTSAWNFVLGDGRGHEVDVHVFTLDGDGNRAFGPVERDQWYPAWLLTAVGVIGGLPVRCIGASTSAIQAADTIVTMVGARRSSDGVPFLVALDGRSGSGKSAVAEAIAERTPAAIVVGDDFYAGGEDADWAQRSPRARAEEVIDWRRLRTQALEPLLAGRAASWHPLDFEPGVGAVGFMDDTVTVDPAPTVVLDGVYSSRPELADLVDLSMLVGCPDRVRRRRLIEREGDAFMQRWHTLWDAAEDHYFAEVRPPESFDARAWLV